MSIKYLHEELVEALDTRATFTTRPLTEIDSQKLEATEHRIMCLSYALGVIALREEKDKELLEK